MDDTILTGESTQTPSDSPSGNQTSDNGNQVIPQGAETPSPEEAQWNSLTGNSQDRFRQVTRASNELRRKVEELQSQVSQFQNTATIQPAYNPAPTSPDVAAAVQKLDEFGVATKKYTEDLVNQKVMSLLYQTELEKLEGKFDGDNGLPKFDRDEYEDYIARHPQYRNYSPEDVYQKMYEPEIFDWKTQHQGRSVTATQSPTLKPTRTAVRENELTPDMIEQRLKEPDGRAWYERNQEKINAVLSKATSE